MKKIILIISLLALVGVSLPVTSVNAQDEAPVAAGELVTTDGEKAPEASSGGGGFWATVFGSGPLAFILWLTIFGAAGAAVYFAVDCAITVRADRIIPQVLVDNVTEAMAEGDVLKALQSCDDEPGALANVLSSGFSHVEEGYDVIEEAISTAADLETEKLMQKLTWLSVVGNLAPMLGLLGTVQGMIAAFSTLGAGDPDVSALAGNISQALFTTAAGLAIAIPCVTCYYIFRNTANTIVLRMEALTMEMIKDLRHVEVVEED